MRGRSHDTEDGAAVFARAARARGADGAGPGARRRDAVGVRGAIAAKIGCSRETLRRWAGQGERVEPICRILPIAPSTYHEHAAWRADPSRLPARGQRDAELQAEIRRVFEENLRVYGVRKVWRQLQREGVPVARCTVARLMRDMGLAGVVRGKPVRTTVDDKAAPCPLDLAETRSVCGWVNRQFRVPAPNQPQTLRVSASFGCRISPV